MRARPEPELMDPQDPNIKARFGCLAELVDFLEHYQMPFPCTVHIWQGVPRSVWFVAPEESGRPGVAPLDTPRRRTSDAREPLIRRRDRGTQPNDEP